MTGATGAPIEASADAIVARDVEEGRPGKTAPAGKWPWWAPVAALAAVVALLVGLGLGLLLGGGQSATPVGATTPDTPVSTTPEKPDTTTTTATPTYNGVVQGQVNFVCGGNPTPYPFVGQMQFGAGKFNLVSPQMSPFTGTLVMTKTGFAVQATGDSGMLTGPLTAGTTQTWGLSTTDPGFPCTGKAPFVVQLQTPITVTPTTATGAMVGSGVNGPVVLWNPLIATMGSGGINWLLVALGCGLLAIGAVDLAFHRKTKEEEILGDLFGEDDDDDDGECCPPPRWFKRLTIRRVIVEESNPDVVPIAGDSSGPSQEVM